MMLSKCNFKDDEGNKRTLLAFSPKTIGNDLKRMRQAFLALIIEFFAVYILLLLLFSLWVSVRSKKTAQTASIKPCRIFPQGNKGTILEYNGPERICGNLR